MIDKDPRSGSVTGGGINAPGIGRPPPGPVPFAMMPGGREHGEGSLRAGFLSTAWDIRRAERGGGEAILRRQRFRVAAMIAFARRHCAFYRNRYRQMPLEIPDLFSLPPVSKQELMENFSDWVTDKAVTREEVEAFVSAPDRIGSRYLGRYVVFSTSGTTGRPALFVHDRGAASVYLALAAVRRVLPLLSPRALWSFLRQNGQTATVIATGGHFTSSVIDGLTRRGHPFLSRNNRVFSLLLPLPELVEKLTDFRPAVLGTYPTAMAVLAQEREAGALRIDPVLALSGAEGLSPVARERIASAFGCPVRDTYAASEFMGIAFDCGQGRLHVNADWVILEPVDERYHPVPAGSPSHTVLLTNLANRVQPILRYDLGDSVTEIPGPCRCGSPLPGIRVEGRRDEILFLRSESGGTVPLLPMALCTVIEETSGVRSYQLVQAGPALLRLRIEEAPGHERIPVCDDVVGRLRAFLSSQGLASAEVETTEERPYRDRAGGKLRQIFVDPAFASEIAKGSTTSG
jgi:phenylacetate-CoA ligase